MYRYFLDQFLGEFSENYPFDDKISLSVTGKGNLASWFEVTDFATATMSCAAIMAARLLCPDGAKVTVDRQLTSLWFGMALRPIGWELPPVWDPIAGDYETKDGWIRLHTNAPHHRNAALYILGDQCSREELIPTVAHWQGQDLEEAIVAAGGCAAEMRDLDTWSAHPQGLAIANDPLVDWTEASVVDPKDYQPLANGRLQNFKIVDLTRVLAGPVATRFLAAYGTDVLRIDPPSWEERGIIPEVTLGKRCTGLDLKTEEGRHVFERLVKEADVIVHGLRPSALPHLGYDRESLQAINPSLINISLNAYGWSGPWAERRGFDSLVQMSCGIADSGMRSGCAEKPVPLPVQALDHATGYLMAAAILYSLGKRAGTGQVLWGRLSLARTAEVIRHFERQCLHEDPIAESAQDLDQSIEETGWGPANRIRFPVKISGIQVDWPWPAGLLCSSQPRWSF